MVDLRSEGKVGSVGVSTSEAMLSRLIDETGVVPAVNQVEMHPYFPQAALRAFHAAHGIRTESWSPAGPAQRAARRARGRRCRRRARVTPTQAVLRWHTQLGSTPIPKSATPARQHENADIFGFTLTDDEMAALSSLERGRLWGGIPRRTRCERPREQAVASHDDIADRDEPHGQAADPQRDAADPVFRDVHERVRHARAAREPAPSAL
jgi:diketogulonate reductase-like aldo/keto reductase